MANLKVFNPLTPPFDEVRDDLADLTTKNHSSLDQLAWSLAGHTMDADLDMNGNDILNALSVQINATADHTITNSSDDLIITNPNSNKDILFNVNRAGTSGNLLQLDASEGIVRLNAASGAYSLNGLFNITGSMAGSGLTGLVGFNPTVGGTASYVVANLVQPTINVAAPVIAFYLNPTWSATVNRSMETIRSVGWTHTANYTDTIQIITEQSFARQAISFSGNDVGNINYNEIVLGGSYSTGDAGFTVPNYTENIITLTGGASRIFGTNGTIVQRGIWLKGYGTIPATGTNTIRAIEADGGLISHHADYGTNNKMLFGAGEDAGIGYDGTDFVINAQLVGTGDVLFPNDNQALALGAGSGGDMRVYYDGTNGNIDTDAVAASDLTIDCGADKTLVLEVPVYDDLRVTPAGFDRAGIADPALVSYTPTGSSIATYLYEFQKNDIAYFTVQLPHGYKEGTDISVHIHWTPGLRGNEENGATVGWKVDYAWANINGTFGAMSTADLSDACDGTDDKHQMTPAVTITGTSKTISSMLICNIKRTDTGADDTWAGTASGELPMILEIDFHYQIDTLGSRTISSK